MYALSGCAAKPAWHIAQKCARVCACITTANTGPPKNNLCYTSCKALSHMQKEGLTYETLARTLADKNATACGVLVRCFPAMFAYILDTAHRLAVGKSAPNPDRAAQSSSTAKTFARPCPCADHLLPLWCSTHNQVFTTAPSLGPQQAGTQWSSLSAHPKLAKSAAMM